MNASNDARRDTSPLAEYQLFLQAGELAYQFDTAAQRPVFYPRLVSPFGGPLEWRRSAGVGTVHAVTWVPMRDGDPYSVVLVDMDEGFRLMSSVRGVAADKVRIGDRVQVRVEQTEGGEPLPVFDRIDEGARSA